MVSIERSKNGQFYARITGWNNEKLMRSETLKSKQSVLKNLHAVYLQLEEIFGDLSATKQIEVVDNTKKKKRVKTNVKL